LFNEIFSFLRLRDQNKNLESNVAGQASLGVSSSTKLAINISGGDQSKTNAGVRRAWGADTFTPQRNLGGGYPRPGPGLNPFPYKPVVKVTDDGRSHFRPDNGGNPPDCPSKPDPKNYRNGPSPFKDDFNYDNPEHTKSNIGFSIPRRVDHSYDGHAKDCFNITGNRNTKTKKAFKEKIRNFIESLETERFDGSYRYEVPAYHYKRPDQNLIVTVNATNNEYISVRNATQPQLDRFLKDYNLGLDSRPILLESQKSDNPEI
jgi:hypothetical protein